MESYNFHSNIDTEINQVGEANNDFAISTTLSQPPLPRRNIIKYIRPLAFNNDEEETKGRTFRNLWKHQRKVFYYIKTIIFPTP